MRIVVVLPGPLLPTKPNTAPGRALKLKIAHSVHVAVSLGDALSFESTAGHEFL